jgi:hypothetical protein
MRFRNSWAVLGVLAIATSACVQREFSNEAGTKNTVKSEPGVTQVDAAAFNAFNIWRDGIGAPILDYPVGYDVFSQDAAPDGVFYVAPDAYLKKDKFIGSVTEGATVEGDVLTYPTKQGRALALRFSAPAEITRNHLDAVRYCKKKGLRLPHIQEVFDFCAAGTAKGRDGKYPDNRCKKNDFLSASVYSPSPYNAWQFSALFGEVTSLDRSSYYGMRCVGAP